MVTYVVIEIQICNKSVKKRCGIDIQPLMDLLPTFYKVLKEYVKKNGHLTLVDIKSSDGHKISIKV